MPNFLDKFIILASASYVKRFFSRLRTFVQKSKTASKFLLKIMKAAQADGKEVFIMVNQDVIICPFCGENYSFHIEYKRYEGGIERNVGNANKYYFNIINCSTISHLYNAQSVYEISISKCPHCEEENIEIKSCLSDQNKLSYVLDKHLVKQIRPKSIHMTFPDYIPKAIYDDYTEACAILELSPKASATLARRALEGMILDFWKIPSKAKGSLKKEIDELQGKIPTSQWKAIDALRNLGNIGAHMEKDVNVIVDIDPGEADKLIRLIELLIQQWYIAQHEQEQLYNDIVDIDNNKQEERKNAGNIPAQN